MNKVILDKTPLTKIDLSETPIYKYRPSYEKLEQELERYKNRIDKVMEYIKNTRYKEKLTVGGLSPYEVDCLLEKLKGE